jgi:predicted Zn-dependent peptidase
MKNDRFSVWMSGAVKAFNKHPYRNEVIGSIADLNVIQRDDLYAHYRITTILQMPIAVV